jgi:hypothetical protein
MPLSDKGAKDADPIPLVTRRSIPSGDGQDERDLRYFDIPIILQPPSVAMVAFASAGPLIGILLS